MASARIFARVSPTRSLNVVQRRQLPRREQVAKRNHPVELHAEAQRLFREPQVGLPRRLSFGRNRFHFGHRREEHAAILFLRRQPP